VGLIALGLAGSLCLYSVSDKSFFLSGQILTASAVAPLFAFALTYNCLKAQGVGKERIITSFASVISGLILFEVVYHYGWPGALVNLPHDLIYFNIFPADLSNGLPFPLPFYTMIILMPFAFYKFMRLNILFSLLLFGSMATFAIWEGLGYPQWALSQGDPLTAEILNSVAKLFVLTLPASLFYGGNRQHQ
jgi:hypothetical protein